MMKIRNRSEYFREWYAKNRDRIIARARAWDLAHPERAKEKKREYKERHPDRVKAANCVWSHKPEVKAAKNARRNGSAEFLASAKQFRETYRDTLAECYVRRLVAQKLGVKGSELPQAIVDVKRVQLQLLRLIKERQNENIG